MSCAIFSTNILTREHWQLVERKRGPSATPWLSKTHHILISILIQLQLLHLNITHTQSITAWIEEWLDFRLVSSSFSDYRAGTSNESFASQISPARTVRWKTSRFQVDPDKHLISIDINRYRSDQRCLRSIQLFMWSGLFGKCHFHPRKSSKDPFFSVLPKAHLKMEAFKREATISVW